MQLCLLHLDDALKNQHSFMETCRKDGAREIEATGHGSRIRLWGKDKNLKMLHTELKQHLSNNNEPQLCFMGSGDFHHITALILSSALEKYKGKATIIHFDNHPDWVKFEGGMHCGSWVNSALKYPQIEKIITIGVCSNDLKNPSWKGANLSLLSEGKLEVYPYDSAPSRVRSQYGEGASFKQKDNHLHWQNIKDIGEDNFIKFLLTRITTQNIYITLDKDVLSRSDAETNWDQGIMRLPFLLDMLRTLGKNHTIIGADVTGDYSKPHYSGWAQVLKRAEIFLDQPFKTPCQNKASALNEAANHEILKAFSEVMA